MKSVSPNLLAAAGCLSLLLAVTYAKEHQEQRVRVLQDADASLSMAAIGNSDWWGGGGWTPPLMTGSKSAKSDGGSAKSAKSEWEGVGDWSKSAKSDGGSAKSAKSEWEGVGDWSKSAKSDGGSAKSAKSEWEGVGDWSKSAKSDGGSAKSAKSEWEGVGDLSKSSKSGEVALGQGPVQICSEITPGCYQEAITCPAEQPPDCNGLDFTNAYCTAGNGCVDLPYEYPANCDYYYKGIQVYVSVECPAVGSKSAKSEGTSTKSSKSEASLGKGPITTCETSQRDGCYQEVATCPILGQDPIEFCNGNEAVGSICLVGNDQVCDNADGLDLDLDNCDGESVYASVACPGASKSAKSESIGDWSKSSKSDGGIGDWSKSSKSKSAKSVDMVDTPPPGKEWVCGWSLPNGMIMPSVDELMAMIEKYDINEDTVAAALAALEGLWL